MSEDADLPRALVKRIAKNKLAGLEKERAEKAIADGKEGLELREKDIQISKDALLALSESARVFIHYLTATGNDICKESKRQIMSVDDIFTALEDLEFGELLPPLKESLEGFKVENKEKSKKRAEQQKKRKLEDAERQAEAARNAALNEAVQNLAQSHLAQHHHTMSQMQAAPITDNSMAGAQQFLEGAHMPSSTSPSNEPNPKVPRLDHPMGEAGAPQDEQVPHASNLQA